MSARAAAPAGTPAPSLGELPARVNIGAALKAVAAGRPAEKAVIAASGRGFREVTFAELDELSDAYAAGLAERGVRSGDRVSLFVRAGVELVALTFALFKAGAVPVLIDPGMGRRRLLDCVARARPRVLIGVPRAQLARRLFPEAFRSVELAVCAGPGLPGAGVPLAALRRAGTSGFRVADTRADEAAAVLFTSGSTGPAKGVLYTHGMFDAQVRALATLYGLGGGGVDVACFPLFALFNAALASTSVFPAMDPSHPARCDPARIVESIERFGARGTFGSPAVWRRVVPWCRDRGRRLAGLERVLVFGAPIAPALVEGLRSILPDGDVHTPYGATEALPVASISGREILERARALTESGAGNCVGRPAPGVELRVIGITDEPVARWSDELEVGPGELGEICVRGPAVTREYCGEAEATLRAKIRDGTEVWHRMGDLGYLDEEGLLWFCGRKSHRLETAAGRIAPVPVENVFNVHPDVFRTALVGVGPRGAERPVLVVEPEASARGALRSRARRERLIGELRAIGAEHPQAAGVFEVLLRKSLPVDVRHNAKIGREELKLWAEERSA